MSFILATEYLRETHQNTSLNFQFILSELIDSYQEIATLQKLLQRVKQGIDQQLISLLHSSLTKLAGSSHDSISLSTSSNQEGSLLRLKNYSAHLFIESKKGRLAFSKMHSCVNTAFINSLDTLNTLQTIEKNKISFKNRYQHLYQTLKAVINPMRHFLMLTSQVIQEFHRDENVLFFILQHKSDLAKLYGTKFVITCFNQMYPQGIKEALDFMIYQYTKRGYDHLTVLIQKEFAELS